MLPAADKKSKSGKPPDVEVEEITVVRRQGLFLLDGYVLVNRAKSFKGLIVQFEFFAPGDKLISKQEIPATKERLEAGDEVEFHAQCVDHVRAVTVRVNCVSGKHMYLSTENTGPFPIE